jgi:hypothetical protein
MFAKGFQMLAPAGDLTLTVAGYLAILAVLTIFGIWGFRLGSRGNDGNGGGGSKRPEPQPPPSPGGRELDDAADFAAWEAQLQSSDADSAVSDQQASAQAGSS